MTFMTTSTDVILLPEGQSGEKYKIPGYDSNSTEIVFVGLSNPLLLSSGQDNNNNNNTLLHPIIITIENINIYIYNR